MPDGEEPGANARTDTEARLKELLRLKDELLQSKTEEVDSLRAKLLDAETAKESVQQELRDEKSRTNRAVDEATSARREAKSATVRADEYKTDLEKDNSFKRLLAAELEARRGLRDFVQQSLSDILAGVDDAAVDARDRQLDGGLKESGFITPGGVGFPSGTGRDSVVDFDLAVVAGTREVKGQTDGQESEVKAKISFMDVIPLGFSAEARSSARSERRSENSSDLTRHNRIRFSVPVTFASLDDPAE